MTTQHPEWLNFFWTMESNLADFVKEHPHLELHRPDKSVPQLFVLNKTTGQSIPIRSLYSPNNQKIKQKRARENIGALGVLYQETSSCGNPLLFIPQVHLLPKVIYQNFEEYRKYGQESRILIIGSQKQLESSILSQFQKLLEKQTPLSTFSKNMTGHIPKSILDKEAKAAKKKSSFTSTLGKAKEAVFGSPDPVMATSADAFTSRLDKWNSKYVVAGVLIGACLLAGFLHWGLNSDVDEESGVGVVEASVRRTRGQRRRIWLHEVLL